MIRSVLIGIAVAVGVTSGLNALASDSTPPESHALTRYTLIQATYSDPTEYQTVITALQSVDVHCTTQIAVEGGELFLLIGCP